jgi:hypothetical protein
VIDPNCGKHASQPFLSAPLHLGMLTTVQLNPLRPPRGLQNARGRKPGSCVLGQVIAWPKKAASPSPQQRVVQQPHRSLRKPKRWSNDLPLQASPGGPVEKFRRPCTPPGAPIAPTYANAAASLKRRRPKLTLVVKMSDQGNDSRVIRDYEDWVKLKRRLAQALEAYESNAAYPSFCGAS